MPGGIVFNGGDQLFDAAEHAAADAFVSDLAEPAFDEVQPRTARGREMKMETLVPFEPRRDLRMFVRRVSVDDHMQIEIGRRFPIDQHQELDELLMARCRGMHLPINLPSVH